MRVPGTVGGRGGERGAGGDPLAIAEDGPPPLLRPHPRSRPGRGRPDYLLPTASLVPPPRRGWGVSLAHRWSQELEPAFRESPLGGRRVLRFYLHGGGTCGDERPVHQSCGSPGPPQRPHLRGVGPVARGEPGAAFLAVARRLLLAPRCSPNGGERRSSDPEAPPAARRASPTSPFIWPNRAWAAGAGPSSRAWRSPRASAPWTPTGAREPAPHGAARGACSRVSRPPRVPSRPEHGGPGPGTSQPAPRPQRTYLPGGCCGTNRRAHSRPRVEGAQALALRGLAAFFSTSSFGAKN